MEQLFLWTRVPNLYPHVGAIAIDSSCVGMTDSGIMLSYITNTEQLLYC